MSLVIIQDEALADWPLSDDISTIDLTAVCLSTTHIECKRTAISVYSPRSQIDDFHKKSAGQTPIWISLHAKHA